MDEFLQSYLIAALWSSKDSEEEYFDGKYSIHDLEDTCMLWAERDCERFQKENAEHLEGLDDSQCGNDFWLTRNGHGAGFWDRGYPKEISDALTNSSKAFGELSLIEGNDGKVYFG
jgi:hypothetical protein